MSGEQMEVLSDNGDRFIVRDCDEDEGCTVIERFLPINDREAADGDEPEPAQCIDIPADVLANVVEALASARKR